MADGNWLEDSDGSDGIRSWDEFWNSDQSLIGFDAEATLDDFGTIGSDVGGAVEDADQSLRDILSTNPIDAAAGSGVDVVQDAESMGDSDYSPWEQAVDDTSQSIDEAVPDWIDGRLVLYGIVALVVLWVVAPYADLANTAAGGS